MDAEVISQGNLVGTHQGGVEVLRGKWVFRTVYDYLHGDEALEGFEFLEACNGKTFKQIPRHLQRRIENSNIQLHIVEPGTKETELSALLERLGIEQAWT